MVGVRIFVDPNNTRSLYLDTRRNLWIGTEGDGLKRYDMRAQRFEYFLDVLRAALPEAQRNDELRVFAIAPADANGQLWVSSNRGVFRLDSLPADCSANRACRQQSACRNADTRHGCIARLRPCNAWSRRT